MVHPKADPDAAKGATEDGPKDHHDNTSMKGQIGHRDQDSLLKDADSDYPEPGLNPEHTGEPQS